MAGQVLGKVTAGGGTHLISNTFYGTCETAAATAAKIIKLTDTNVNSLSLIPGMLLTVKFTNSNSVANPTFTIQTNSGTALSSAISVKQYEGTNIGTGAQNSWYAGAIVAFTYDGTNWIEISSASGGTEEVSIGSTEPTDNNIKIWIRV